MWLQCGERQVSSVPVWVGGQARFHGVDGVHRRCVGVNREPLNSSNSRQPGENTHTRVRDVLQHVIWPTVSNTRERSARVWSIWR